MGFAFKDVTVTAFDAHPAVEPLRAQSADYVRQGFDFLLDGQKYNARYDSGQAVKTGLGEFRPLPAREFKKHFWEAYYKATGGQRNPWRMLLPFVCRPKESGLNLNLAGAPDLRVTAQPVIYLSPIGWSTNVLFRFQGTVRQQALIGLMDSIVNKTPARMPFLVGGEPANMTAVFRYFQRRLLEEVYSEEKEPHAGMKIPRHVVVSLNKFVGEPVEYKEMTPADQGLMRGILFGREIDAKDELAEQQEEEKKQRPLLPTHISNPYNFALTDFDHGTLVFLQRDALDAEREGAVHCHDRNIANFLMMTFSLLKFHQESEDAEPGTPLAALRDDARGVLHKLSKSYRNQFCNNLFLKHAALKKLISAP